MLCRHSCHRLCIDHASLGGRGTRAGKKMEVLLAVCLCKAIERTISMAARLRDNFVIFSPQTSIDFPLTSKSPPVLDDNLRKYTHLIQIDHRLPELILQLVEIPHSNLSKVTRMVLVQVCSMMMLTTSHATATRMLSVLPYTTMTGRNVSATKNGLKRVSEVAQLKFKLLKGRKM